MTPASQRRDYRQDVRCAHLAAYRVRVRETDLQVQAERALPALTRNVILECRGYIERYIERFPEFGTTLSPWRLRGPAPAIVRDMVRAAAAAGVGPMAAVAGAVAEYTARRLLSHSREVIVENGGDVFLKTRTPLTVGLLAPTSALKMHLGIRLPAGDPLAVCTSSGRIGHSFSFGRADAVCVVSASGALSDAAATAIGNRVRGRADIRAAIESGRRIPGIDGIVVVCGGGLGMWGALELVELGKKG